MKTQFATPLLSFFLKMGVLMGVAIVNFSAQSAPTIWNGPTTNFAQAAVPLGALPVADVLIPGSVSLTRNGNHWLYNTNVDVFGADTGTPSDTEWSFGALDNFANLTYTNFDSFRNFNLSGVLLGGGPMVCHLMNEDIYLSVQFSAWPHGGGLIAYTRSTPASVTPPPPTPSVTITNPANGAVFAAPANVTIGAHATVSSGTVTNVLFFGNANLLGQSQAPPFTITANGLTSGNYALTAVALAGGISATSSVVNISVVTPVVTSLTAAPASVTNNQFSFSYSATPGLRYEVDISSNLFNWIPVATNVATGNLVFFTNNISGTGSFFRVDRLPNP